MARVPSIYNSQYPALPTSQYRAFHSRVPSIAYVSVPSIAYRSVPSIYISVPSIAYLSASHTLPQYQASPIAQYLALISQYWTSPSIPSLSTAHCLSQYQASSISQYPALITHYRTSPNSHRSTGHRVAPRRLIEGGPTRRPRLGPPSPRPGPPSPSQNWYQSTQIPVPPRYYSTQTACALSGTRIGECVGSSTQTRREIDTNAQGARFKRGARFKALGARFKRVGRSTQTRWERGGYQETHTLYGALGRCHTLSQYGSNRTIRYASTGSNRISVRGQTAPYAIPVSQYRTSYSKRVGRQQHTLSQYRTSHSTRVGLYLPGTTASTLSARLIRAVSTRLGVGAYALSVPGSV
eukprot:2760895-Rhodomonas_salina.1